MPTTADERPPYLMALAVAGAVLAGYIATLAPSVTFWDAGELIAASKILGIPHPPGTPFFVTLAHVWAGMIPVGEYAWRTNLLSATFSAAGAGFWFLTAHEALRPSLAGIEPGAARLLRAGGGVAAAMASAFSYTQWQNSNETEVYAVATFTIAAIVWLALRWRASRGTTHASKMLLMAVYLGGLSMGNHLLALLVGPALVGFLAAVLWRDPAATSAERQREWGEVAVVGGIWALLIGTGLGSTPLVLMGGICFGVATTFAVRWGSGRFALLTWVLASVGVTTYLILFIRAGHRPMINEADPSSWEALLAVIRRQQYPVRTPLDDPTQLHGPDNPGRTLTLVGLQLLNYVQYFDWQWAMGLKAKIASFPLRTLATMAFVSLGVRGMAEQYRNDRASWWLVFLLFLTTGLGLVGYMNFKPGYSIGYEQFPAAGDHEVRERDYFFVVSFIAWGVWAGMGLASTARHAIERWRWRPAAASVLLVVGLLPFLLNFTAASRRHGPDARLAGDFAYDLLNSVPPYGILFTYGDNDTFPLWWAQEVQGIRQDVTVICLALAETDWYMRQLRENPVRPFDEAGAPAIWRGYQATRPDWPLHTMSDAEIADAVPQAIPSDVRLRFGPHEVTLARNTVLYGKDFLSIRVLQQNVGRRPIAWALSAAGSFYQLNPWLVQQGLAIRVLDAMPDSLDTRYDFRRMMGAPLDLATTDSLLMGTYRYAGLLDRGADGLDPTPLSTAATLGVPFTQMAYAAEARGDLRGMVRYLEVAARLSTNPAIRATLEELRSQLPAQEP
jgi:hypothetical protein